jgi:hypothetical protein
MLRSSKALIAGAVAGIAFAGTLAGTALAGPGVNPNDPATYGPGCTKVEFVDGTTTYEVPAGVIVYIKAGPGDPVQYIGPTTVTLDKDISYVITCPAPSPSPTYT